MGTDDNELKKFIEEERDRRAVRAYYGSAVFVTFVIVGLIVAVWVAIAVLHGHL